MGHADDKKRDKPSTITPMEHANIGCDEDTEISIESGIEARSFKTLPGYQAMIQLNGRWVTTKFCANICHENTAPDIVTYLQKRLDICPKKFNNTNWGAIGTVRSLYGIA